MDSWLKFYELITKPLPVASSLFLFFATSFLLLAGDPTLARLGLSRAITNYRWAVGLGFIISVAWLVVTGLLLLWKWIITLRKENERKKRLHALTADERRILSQYVQDESRSCIFHAAPDIAAAHGLADDGVLYKPDAQPDGAAVAYNILEWALAYLSQHRELLAATVPSETRWKSEGLNMKTFLRVMAAFAGIVVGLALVGFGYYWITHRPKQWDTSAITGEFERVDTEGEGQTSFMFYFVLENHTNRDYSLESNSTAPLYGRIQESKSLWALKPGQGDIDFPIFVPQHGRARLVLRLPSYGYSAQYANKAAANNKQRRAQVAEYLNEQMENLNGFEIFDHANHYEIILPAGWKQSKSQ